MGNVTRQAIACNVVDTSAKPTPAIIAKVTRGFAVKQLAPEITIADTRFDRDTVRPDELGDLPFWMIAQPTTVDVLSA